MVWKFFTVGMEVEQQDIPIVWINYKSLHTAIALDYYIVVGRLNKFNAVPLSFKCKDTKMILENKPFLKAECYSLLQNLISSLTYSKTQSTITFAFMSLDGKN